MDSSILRNKYFRLLYEISTIINSSMDIATILNKIIHVLKEKMCVQCCTITLLDKQSQKLSIIASIGTACNEKCGVSYDLGEGVTGMVAKTGRPMIVPKISDEPMFLNKTKARSYTEPISFICVPIQLKNEVIGTFSVDRLFNDEESLENDLELLAVITSIIAEKIKVLESISAEKRLLLLENERLKTSLQNNFSFSKIIGKASGMKDVFKLIEQVAKSNANVLIRGESGTGKELIASAIHYNSERASKPFVKINCSAIPEDLIEAELFGHEKGAFTDAKSFKKGRFELANGGTLFLDEIGELSPSIQIKLLRVLQEREFERLGGVETIKTDVRLITATNRDLEKSVTEGTIRQDFYYRINVFPIFVPPLRERKPDILLLADRFVEQYAKENNKGIFRICTLAIDMMMSYHWPGNVRELENCIERAVILSDDGVIHGYHLPPTLQVKNNIMNNSIDDFSLELRTANYEKDIIIDILKETRGNILQASKLLQTTNRKLNYKVKQYNIDTTFFKAPNYN
jgi:Nif-specific regulatory protein